MKTQRRTSGVSILYRYLDRCKTYILKHPKRERPHPQAFRVSTGWAGRNRHGSEGGGPSPKRVIQALSTEMLWSAGEETKKRALVRSLGFRDGEQASEGSQSLRGLCI